VDEVWVATTLVGAVLLVATLTDLLTTTVNVTERSGRLASGVFAVTRRPLQRLLPPKARPSVAMAQVVALLVTWTFLLWGSWWLIMVGEPIAFEHGDGRVADALDTLYVAGFGVFALGVGDIGPSSRAAQLLLPLSSATGLALVTLEITYLLSLNAAAAHKRQVARMVQGLGEDADRIVRHSWDGTSFASAGPPLSALATELALLAEHQLAYPVLYQFGARREQEAVAPGLVGLLDALHLMHDRTAPWARLPELTHRQLIAGMASLVEVTPVEGDDVVVSPRPGLALLETLGVPTVDTAVADPDEPLRRRLHVLAFQEGRPVAGEAS
jgi:hypothetical protein